jgi:aminoglycoside phosphotransferase (APT) family kinase protein
MQAGGFSPGVAARVQAADGRRVFVKAVGPELNPDSPDMFRQEARIVAALPATILVPRLLWSYDEGPDGWVMLVFEDIEGRNPAQPWRADELDRVIDALVELSAVLTPSTVDAPSASDAFASDICGWQLLLEEELSPQLDPWSVRHLEALAALEAAAPAAAQGRTLLHFDVRADNILLTADQVYFVDWPSACIGVPWIDLAASASSVAMQGGPQPEDLLMRHPAARKADPDAITAVVASVAGYLTRKALLPPPPGLPTVRAFQAAQGIEARRWLAQRTGWTEEA